MTIIRPKRTTASLSLVIGLLVGALFVSSIFLVVLYNRLVNLNHAITRVSAEFKDIQLNIAELHDKTFSLFNKEYLEEFARGRGLVEDRTPQYLPIGADAAEVTLVSR